MQILATFAVSPPLKSISDSIASDSEIFGLVSLTVIGLGHLQKPTRETH